MASELNEQLDRGFRDALRELIDGVENLDGHDLAEYGPPGTGLLPWLQRPGSAGGGYYVYAGLGEDPSLPPRAWYTFVTVSWVDDREGPAGDDHMPLDVRVTGPGARDPRILAAMALTAVLADLDARENEYPPPSGP
jgi:hypothetical protein